MSSIDKLSIMGVRSFDNQVRETIQFYSPLTLIVGHNGSGKTTIIECLKYATTGDLPPNATKGGAFIHDPKMCGEKEVMAQVKLGFYNTANVRMICTRSLQLTVKKTTRAQKTLDGQLVVMKNGERATLSTRCADLDAQMPISLGVSKAVLENVIFCHQEESNWPLSEPSVLKKKFDDIFEAVKYTKALDQIKTLRKDQAVQIKIDQNTLEHLKSDKERSDKIKAQSDAILQNVSQSQERIEQLDAQLKDLTGEQDELFDSNQAFQQIIADLQQSRQQYALMEDQLHELKKDLTEYEESDEQLQDMQANFASRMQAAEGNVHVLSEQRADMEHRMAELRHELNAKLSELGRINAQSESHAHNLQKRSDLIKDISRRHNYRGYDMPGALDESQIEEFTGRLQRSTREQTAALERIKREGRETEQEANAELQKFINTQSSAEQAKNSAKNQIRSLENVASDFVRQLEDMRVDEGDVAMLESTRKDAEAAYQAAKDDVERTNWDVKIEEKQREARKVEEKIDRVNKELSKGHAQSSLRAKLELAKNDAAKKREGLTTIIAANSKRFKELVGRDLNQRTVEVEIREVLGQKNNDLEDAERLFDGSSKELSQVETKLSIAKHQLKAKKLERTDAEKAVLQVCNSVEDLPTEIQQTEKAVADTSGALKSLEFATSFFQRSIDDAEEQHWCRLCCRGIGEDEQDAVLNAMRQALGKIPQKAAETEQQLEDLKRDMQNLRDAQPYYERFMRLQSEDITKLEEDVKKLNDRVRMLAEKTEGHQSAVDDIKSAIKDIDALKRPAGDMTRYDQDIKDIETNIRTFESQLRETGGTRTIEEMQAELAELTDEAKAIKKQIDNFSTEKDKLRQSVFNLHQQVRDAERDVVEAQHKLQQKQQLQRRVDENRAQARRLQDDIANADETIRGMQPRIAEAKETLRQVREAAQEQESSASREAGKLQQSLNQLNDVSEEIESYVSRGGPAAQQRCQTEVEDLQNASNDVSVQIAEITEKVDNLKGKLAETKTYERNISDNLRARRMERDLRTLSERIYDLESKNAEQDRDRYQEQVRRLKIRYDKLFAERAGLMGEVKQLDDQLKRYQREYDLEYKDAHANYRKQHIKVKTMTAANEDLAKYGKALDTAIMKYHSLKMEEINRIIDELWKKTYSGTDVDTIIIRSESESATSKASTARSSYNYRVCMVKQDAELDMRGRCSAGQKVLASIIIRLALAECFGINCGILALDEPTTNLDRENILSLARSLSGIIKARRAQRNFQLIVITHDEEFLNMMGCSDYTDYYYRISRNEQQKSVIERQRITDVL
ncbi:DNA repair protein rad50 [Saitoella coloradoensis]